METIINNNPPHPMAQLDANEAALAARFGLAEAPYIPPTEKFYHSNYILDGCVAAELRTAYGYYDSAAKQLNSFRKTQRPDGMVPGVSHLPKRFTFNPERWLSTPSFEGNDYTQSPDWARVVLLLHDAASNRPAATPERAINPDSFLLDVYPDLRRYYLYFVEKRQVAAGDPRAFMIHPHEGNRDSSPDYDQWKQDELERQLGKLVGSLMQRKPRTGEHMPVWFNQRNRVIDYAGAIAINLAGYTAGWDPARIHENTEFVDVWFNGILYENYEAMAELAARLGRAEDAGMFTELAIKLEQAMGKHYFPKARDGQGAFYSIYNGQPQYKDTIGNLMSLLLKNLPQDQLRSNLVLMNEAFDTPFVLPSVATDDVANYDPHYEEKDRHWRTPVWAVANRKAMRGLDKHVGRSDILETLRDSCLKWFQRIHHSNLGMVAVTGGYAEHHNPLNGMGQRMHRTGGHVFGVAAHLPI